MGTIADKLTYLGETKSDLRATLNGLLGLSLDANTPFRRYAYEADMAAIRAMFASGELGGYWEPSLNTLYEDSAGTTVASLNGVVGSISNQISGCPSAIQATTANKPYLRKTPTTNRYWLDGNTSTANLTATFSSSLGSSCTIARLDPELGVQWSESQTIGTTYNLITPYAYHGPMLIINRALTAQEKAVVERVMGRFMPQLGPNIWSWSAAVKSTISYVGDVTRLTNNGAVLGGAYLGMGVLNGKSFIFKATFTKGTANTAYLQASVDAIFGFSYLRRSSSISATLKGIFTTGGNSYASLMNSNQSDAYSDFSGVELKEIL